VFAIPRPDEELVGGCGIVLEKRLDVSAKPLIVAAGAIEVPAAFRLGEIQGLMEDLRPPILLGAAHVRRVSLTTRPRA
jgi:hypothetical protein